MYFRNFFVLGTYSLIFNLVYYKNYKKKIRDRITITSMKVEVGETLVANQRVLKYATGLRTGFEYLLLELNIRS